MGAGVLTWNWLIGKRVFLWEPLEQGAFRAKRLCVCVAVGRLGINRDKRRQNQN